MKTDPLRWYMNTLKDCTPLPPEEELRLIRLQKAGDKGALQVLVKAHLRLVVKMVYEYQTPVQLRLDLFQEGNMGLLRAIQIFDPSRGVKLSHYAAFWIKARILACLLRNRHMVRLDTRQKSRKILFGLAKATARLEARGDEVTPASLAKELGVTDKDVESILPYFTDGDVWLDTPRYPDSNETRVDSIPAVTTDPDKDMEGNRLDATLTDFRETLSPKERDIWDNRLRSEEPVKLREIAARYGVTRERIRQIEVGIKEKLVRWMEEEPERRDVLRDAYQAA